MVASWRSSCSRRPAGKPRDARARRSRRLVDADWIEGFIEDAEHLRALAKARFAPDRMDDDEFAAHVLWNQALGSVRGDEEDRGNLAIAFKAQRRFLAVVVNGVWLQAQGNRVKNSSCD